MRRPFKPRKVSYDTLRQKGALACLVSLGFPSIVATPTARPHPNGEAFLEIDSRRRYLGKWGLTESRQRYARLIADPPTCGSLPSPAAAPPAGANLTISELILMYWQFAKSYYVKDGGASKEQASMREALRPMRRP